MMQLAWARNFAAEWAQAWNDRDVEQVLTHFHDDVAFTSPTAVKVTGAATLRGKDALRDYWTTAMRSIGALTFTVERVVWDDATRAMVIVYASEIDGHRRRVAEHLTFDVERRVVHGEAFHGVDQ